MKVFLAGATGVVGKRLIPLLVQAGHSVTGTTRSSQKAAAIRDADLADAIFRTVWALRSCEARMARTLPSERAQRHFRARRQHGTTFHQ